MNEITAVEHREKHLELHEAIQGLNLLIGHMDELIERMEGPSPVSEPANAVHTGLPTFMEVLNDGAEVIREKTEGVDKRIQRLTDLLF